MSTTTAQLSHSLETSHMYAVRKYKEVPAREGVAWFAEILRNGKMVGTAENSGRGGCNNYYFTDRADQTAFVDAAKLAMPAEADYPEVDDLFIETLITVLQMNRMRSIAFRFDGDVEGSYRTVGGKTTREQAIAGLRLPPYAARNPQVWDKTVSGWVAV